MKIELKNINLSNVTVEEQVNKFLEEVNEFLYTVLKKDVTNGPKEYLDVVQSGLGLVDKGLNLNADYIMRNCYPEHLKKLENRPREKNTNYWVVYKSKDDSDPGIRVMNIGSPKNLDIILSSLAKVYEVLDVTKSC